MNLTRNAFARLAPFCLSLALSPSFSGTESPANYAWSVLRDGAREKSVDHREQAVSCLGLIPGNPEAVKLAENALGDSSKDVRDAAVTALGEMGAKNSVPRIKMLLKDADAHSVLAIAAALKKLNDPGGNEIYYEILTGKRKGSGGILQGVKDKKALEKMGLEEAMGFIPFGGIGWGAYNYIKTNTSLAVNAAAATELALDPDPSAEKALVQAVSDGRDVVKVAALRALAKRGDPAVITNVAHEMYSDKANIKYTAAAAVVRLADAGLKHRSRRSLR